MTNEEMERVKRMELNMAFIVEHQAKFSVDIGRINETLAKHTESLGKHNDAIVGLLQVSRTLVEHQTAAEAQMSEIRVETKEIPRAQKKLFEAQKELFGAQSGTERRLDAFIAFVQKYISGRDGGKN